MEQALEQANAQVILKEKKTKSKYDKPEIINYIIEGKNNNLSFDAIVNGLKERGFDKISPQQVSDLHKKAIARSILVHNTSQESFDDFSNELNAMYAQAMKVLKRHINILDKIADEFETSDMDTLQQYMAFIKLTPQIKMTIDSIFTAIREYREQQDKIITEKQSMVWTSDKMNDYIVEHANDIITEKINNINEKIDKQFPNHPIVKIYKEELATLLR